jgi:CRP/FNR family transcriptional regulator
MLAVENSIAKCRDCINRSDCFNILIPDELDFINQHKEQIIYHPKETICKQGAFANYVMYVAEGLVKTYLETENEKIVNLRIIRNSEFIGFSSLCGKKNYNYSAVALKRSKICLLDNESFKKLLMGNGEFSVEIMKLYCRNEEQIYKKIRSIGYKYMLGRLADTLLYLCDDTFEDYNIFEYITRKDIADFACLSKESTIKLLTNLNQNKIIKSDRHRIEILDRHELERLSNKG